MTLALLQGTSVEWGLVFGAVCETVALVFAIFYGFVAVTRIRPPCPASRPATSMAPSGLAAIYLCCDDLDPRALESIARACALRGIALVVHDDSRRAESMRQVDNAVGRLTQVYGATIRTIRRRDRGGGKPAAVNNALAALDGSVEFVLLCDSDSTVVDDDFWDRALAYFDAADVAIVQFRTAGRVTPADSPGYAALSLSIDFYDMFLAFMDRFGWSAFLGHNAMLRVSVIRALGGFTPGMLADDIDVSVRARLCGHRIRYARDILFQERHPVTYAALRRRTWKWARGCHQVLRAWGWRILTARTLRLSEKATFFLTVSYYHLQGVLCLYLVVYYIVMPIVIGPAAASRTVWPATLIAFMTFAPSLAWFARSGRLRAWPRASLLWALAYGSQDLVVLRAIGGDVLRRSTPWVPTNVRGPACRVTTVLPELGVGLLMVGVIASVAPFWLLAPTTVLFAVKYLAAPLIEGLVFKSGAVYSSGRATSRGPASA